MSSRDVKSTGEKFLVVILPSVVIAKVTATNGRDGFRETRGARFLAFAGDLMLQRGYLTLHFAQFDVMRLATRLVEEVNDSARRTAQ